LNSSAAEPHVAAVVLTHNGREDTLRCLASLAESAWPWLTVIVVDNASEDGTLDAVAERYPDVQKLRQERNVGFAEGNNAGIRHAIALGCDYVLLLNNDTIVEAHAVGACVEVAQRYPDCGAACPLIQFADPSNLIWYGGAVFDPRKAHSGRMVGYREQNLGQFKDAQTTERAVGAAVLIPRPVLQEVGLLDDRLFFLYEDVDWSLRARCAGYQIYLVPEARVLHRVSASSGGEHSAHNAYYDTRNHMVVCRRHAPLRGIASFRREIGILGVHIAGARRAQRRRAYVGAVLRGWRDGRRERLGPCPDVAIRSQSK
jgi:GT2 family glycosyltransferase